MSLTPLQRLDLQDRLADLLIQRPTIQGLDLLELLEQINDVLVQLGYSCDQGKKPVKMIVEPPTGGLPQLVFDYKAGVFNSVPAHDYIETLRQIDAYEPEFISLEEIKKNAIGWVYNNFEKLSISIRGQLFLN